MNSPKWCMINILLISFLVIPFSIFSLDTITTTTPIKDGDVLVSSKKIFALGFFSPGKSRSRYVGVWYNKVPEQTIVWVANRDNPVNDTSGILAISSDGGLVINWKDKSNPIWSSNVTVSSPNNSTAKLLDTGNLVLLENNGTSRRVLWQGFDYPSNTILPFMKIGLNRRSGSNRFLTSWKSPDDPGTGNCSFGIDPSGFPQLIIYKGRAPRWRGGPWIGNRWSGVPEMTANFIVNASFVNNQDELSYSYRITDESIFSRMVLDESGIIARSTWRDQAHQWVKFYSVPVEQCDFYGKCGPNSNCDPYNVDTFECTCMPGFEPKFLHEWYLRDGSGGCVRTNGSSICQNGEGFVKVARVKVPNSSASRVNMSMSLKACEEECLRNCSCMAYSNADDRQGGIGCVTWHGDLIDTRTYLNVGQDLFVRVDAMVLAQYAKKSSGSLNKKGKLAVSLVCGLVVFLLFCFAYWLVKRKRKGKRKQDEFSLNLTTSPTYLEDSINSDLPFFELSTIATATNNFSVHNKLGAGGFGAVYKGVLYNGREVAVKRLAKNSTQGIEEFKNEVVLIAKLQHRNLVRILGCCVKGEERMLIYEYLPNKSLDTFIFNEEKRASLDWTRRHEIICGIARGILYLHQDSRLRIIHRDLKASNVLLDSSMNPKIADFGIARTFGVEQIEANTNHVVGTYGYMSPEYAMEGIFSVKSDVYSFGVLLLEIVSGKKNTGYYHDNPDSNLVGHVWDLWKEGRASEIIDSTLDESCPVNEVLRNIQIGLLCVQEHATDRPTMSGVVSMLGNDATVPSPRQLAFFFRRTYITSGDQSASNEGANSVCGVTCTNIEPR